MIAAHIEPILIVTGAMTAIALIQFIAPLPILRMIFGEAPTDAISLVSVSKCPNFGGDRPVSSIKGPQVAGGTAVGEPPCNAVCPRKGRTSLVICSERR